MGKLRDLQRSFQGAIALKNADHFSNFGVRLKLGAIAFSKNHKRNLVINLSLSNNPSCCSEISKRLSDKSKRLSDKSKRLSNIDKRLSDKSKRLSVAYESVNSRPI